MKNVFVKEGDAWPKAKLNPYLGSRTLPGFPVASNVWEEGYLAAIGDIESLLLGAFKRAYGQAEAVSEPQLNRAVNDAIDMIERFRLDRHTEVGL